MHTRHALFAALAALLINSPVAAQGDAPTIDVTTLGPEPGPGRDAQPAIQTAIERLERAGGGVVRIPAADQPYMIRDAITITGDDITIEGAGATICFERFAMNGEVVDCLEVVGTPDDPAENVVVRGLTIDANYWNQPGSYNPRGFDSDHARNLLVENVTIDRAFVGLTFGYGVTDAEARGCVVTRWYDDGFNASGDGDSGACRDIRFVNCTARNSPDEAHGGLPGVRNNAWEIEDGTHNVTLIDCRVQNAGGNGFAVRNHGSDAPVATTKTTFRNCTASGVSRLGFHVFSQGYPNTIENITLERCSSDGPARLHKDIRGLTIRNSSFAGLLTLGPAKDAVITGSTLGRVRIWSRAVGSPSSPGRYVSNFRFEDCSLGFPLHVLGNEKMVELIDTAVAGTP